MKAFPLIYSRIRKDDYPNGFLARPDDLDVSVALKYVISAMENIAHIGGIRHAVFSVGDYLIYGGAACVAGELVKRILRSWSIDFPYEEYQADKAGRPLIFFIGFAVRKDGLVGSELPDINLYDTYRIYLSYLKRQWNNDNAVTEISEGIELKTRPYVGGPVPLSHEVNGKHILRDYREDDFQEVIDCYFDCMTQGDGGDFSFLSSVLPDDAVRSPFANMSIYGCSPEEGVRMMRGSDTSVSYPRPVGRGGSGLRTNNILDRKIEGVPDTGSSTGEERFSARKKKKTSLPGHSRSLLVVAIGALVAMAIIVLLLLILTN